MLKYFLHFILLIQIVITTNSNTWQIYIELCKDDFEFIAFDTKNLLLNSTMNSMLSCAYSCAKTMHCRTFNFNHNIQQCQMYEGDIDVIGSIKSTNLSYSTCGSIILTSNHYLDYGLNCSYCHDHQYLTCRNSTCQCYVHDYFDGSICRSQKLNGSSCSNNNECRNDLNLTCITNMYCGYNDNLNQVHTSTSTTTTTTSTITAREECTPFWTMPMLDEGTYFNYVNANTRISGDANRSACVDVRTSSSNIDNIVFDIGSNETTFYSFLGCNRHFAFAIVSDSEISVYGMCHEFDNCLINFTQNIRDGNFHQFCVTYDTNSTNLCIYLDLLSPVCLIRTNIRYNTGLGDVRIGWWPDNNRQFNATGGGLIRSMKLFDNVISQACVNNIYNSRAIG